jgi:hypothetical protein
VRVFDEAVEAQELAPLAVLLAADVERDAAVVELGGLPALVPRGRGFAAATASVSSRY